MNKNIIIPAQKSKMIFNTQTLEHIINSTAGVEDFVKSVRWGDYVRCVYCDHAVYRLEGANKRFKCTKCRKQFSIKTRSIMDNSPLPLRKWMLAILLYLEDTNVASTQLARDLDITQKTAYYLLMKVRIIVATQSLEQPNTSPCTTNHV